MGKSGFLGDRLQSGVSRDCQGACDRDGCLDYDILEQRSSAFRRAKFSREHRLYALLREVLRRQGRVRKKIVSQLCAEDASIPMLCLGLYEAPGKVVVADAVEN